MLGKLATADQKNQTIKLWDLQTAQRLRTLRSARGIEPALQGLRPLYFVRGDKSLLATSQLQFVNVDRDEVQPLHSDFRKEGPRAASMVCSALHPNRKILATGHKDETIRLWDLEAGKGLNLIDLDGQVHLMAFAREGKTLVVVITVAEKWTEARAIDVASGKEKGTLLRLSRRNAHPFGISPDGMFLATMQRSADATVPRDEIAFYKLTTP